MPGPAEGSLATSTPYACESQAAIRSAVGLPASALTVPPVTSPAGWSIVAASSARQGVARVQARSVSPGWYPVASKVSASRGEAAAAASVMRRWASAPMGSCPGMDGTVSGHQVTTGVSGSSSGAITESACWPSGPYIRSSIVSPGLVSPTRISASSRDRCSGRRMITTRIRHGCWRPATLAARTASYCAPSSVTMTRVSTMPLATPPSRSRAWRSASWIALVVVSVRSMVMSQPPPCPAVPGHQRVRTSRAGGPGRVLVRLAVLGPELLDRVEHLPGQLDLLVPGEQRRVADEHVQQQPLVRLGAVFGEGLAVGEVHVHVPDLHRGAGDLGAEPDRDALVRLHPDHQCVLAELGGVGGAERQVRGALEQQRYLGHPLRQPLAGAQVERDASPPPGDHAQLQRGVGLGVRVGGDPVFLQVAGNLDAALPAGRVLAAGGTGSQILRQPDRREYLLLLRPQGRGVERDRLLHRGERQQLHQVVLDHVTGGTDPVVVPGPAADPDVLGHGDLYVVHVAAVPDRLVHGVGEPQRQDVLYGLLAQIVVDAEDRVRAEHRVHDLVELPGAGQVMAERLLDHHPPPRPTALGVLGRRGQARALELLHHIGEELGRHR